MEMFFCFVWTIWKISGSFPGHQETFDPPENIQTIWKLSRLSINFPDHPENIQTILKLFRLSGNHPGYPKTFQKVRNLPSVISRVTCKNFPDVLNLSVWQCHDAMMVSTPLMTVLGKMVHWYVVLHYCSKFFFPPPVIKINQSLNWLGVRYKYLFSRPSIRFNGTVAWLWTFLSMTTIQEIISVKDGDEFPPQSISHLLLRPTYTHAAYTWMKG